MLKSAVSNTEIKYLAKEYQIDPVNFLKVLKVETGGRGFAPSGKLLIQFESRWFLHFLGQGKGKVNNTWAANAVGNQRVEWIAFNAAFRIAPRYAMMSTSVGMGQILGLHYDRLGFKSVDEFWNANKKGEYTQVKLVAAFIKSDARLHEALNASNFDSFAYYYNGPKYRIYHYAERLAEA